VADCPYEFYRNWVLNAAATRSKVEEITRAEVGTAECPIPGLPVGGPVG
jgi:amidase